MRRSTLRRWLFATVLVTFAVVPTSGQHNWQETETETIWHERYTNCDYGYYVSLNAGVVAHGSHSPSPNHGFLIALPDVGRTALASTDDNRFVWVDAHYNATDYKTLSDIAKDEIDLTGEGKQRFRVVRRSSAKLAGLSALQFMVEYDAGGSRLLEEQVIALRSDIVYTLGLRTLQANHNSDEEQFSKIRAGFRLLKLPRGPCSNE
jgi:hypothetical protein